MKNKFYNLLRWSEKYTKTDMVYLLKNSFWLNLNTIISSAFSLVLSILFAQYVSKEIYGNYQFLISFASVIGTLTLTGMNAAVTQAVARGYDGILKRSVFIQLKYGVIPLVVGLAASLYYLLNENTSLSYSLIAIAILIPIGSAFNTWSAFLSGKKEFSATFSLGQISSVFYHSMMFACIIIFPQTTALVIVNYLSSTIINILIYLRVNNKYVSNNLEEESSIDYGKKLSLSSILPLISLHIDNILVFHLLGASDLAIYAFASNIPEKFISLIRPISTVAMPKMSVANHDDFRSQIGNKISRLLIFSLGFAIIYILLAPFVYKFLFPEYIESAPYSQVYVLAAAISATTSFVVSFMFASKSTKIYTYNIANPLFNISIMIAGAYFFSIWGLIVSRIIGNGFSLALSYGLERKATT